MDSAKSTVAEDAHRISASGILGNVAYNGVRVRQVRGGLADGVQILDQLLRVEPLVWSEQFQPRDLSDDHGVGIGEG